MTEPNGLAQALVEFQKEEVSFSKTKEAKVKTKTGGEYTYKYADLSDILPAVRPLLAKHGLSWSSTPTRADDGALVLRYRLLHVSGEAEAAEMPLGVSADCKPQELGSAITYARRYAITAQLNLATEEDDDGRAAQESKRPARQAGPNGPLLQPQQPAYVPANVPVVTPADIVHLKTAAKGLKFTQVKLVLTSNGVPFPYDGGAANVFDQVPQAKAAALSTALAEAKRD